MKKLLDWKVLFGLLVLVTILIVSLVLVEINRERVRLRDVITKITESTHGIDHASNRTKATIDSLSNQLTYLSAQVLILEAQKDSLFQATGFAKKGSANSQPSAKSIRPATLTKPVISIVDNTGKVIGEDGISPDSLRGMKVIAGEGFVITGIDVMLARGTSGVTHTRGYGNYDFGSLRGQAKVGDRIVITDLKVARAQKQGGTQERVNVGAVTISVPLRPTKQPYFTLRDIATNIPIDLRKGIDTRGFQGFTVTVGMGYKITEIEVILGRGTAGVKQMIVKSDKIDLKEWVSLMRPGDRIVLDIKGVTMMGKAQDLSNHPSTIFSIPIE